MPNQTHPILLFDDECAVCRHIAGWVKDQAHEKSNESTLIVRPIGNDPEELQALHPGLDIWAAYKTVHVLLPDGSMRLGGDAVAVVLRSLRTTRWFTWILDVSLFGFRPFQTILNLAYGVLADVRPLLGCESCGTPQPWVRPIRWLARLFGGDHKSHSAPHFNTRSASPRPPVASS